MLTRNLPVKLSDEEMLVKGKEVAKLARDISRAESAKSDTAKALGDRIKELNKELEKSVEIVNSGVEFREVECYELKNFAKSTIDVYRRDTEVYVSSRPMTETEKQSELFPLRPVGEEDDDREVSA